MKIRAMLPTKLHKKTHSTRTNVQTFNFAHSIIEILATIRHCCGHCLADAIKDRRSACFFMRRNINILYARRGWKAAKINTDKPKNKEAEQQPASVCMCVSIDLS